MPRFVIFARHNRLKCLLLESDFVKPLVNLGSLRLHTLGILLLGHDADAITVVAIRSCLDNILQSR